MRQAIETIIEPPRGWPRIPWKEVSSWYELLYFLAARDIKSRYKQSVLGAAWAILPPVVQMMIFTVLFGRLGQFDSEGLPFPVFVFAGLLLWALFARVFLMASQSLVHQQHLVTKIYFPRLLIPLASCSTGLIDFIVSLAVFGCILLWYGIIPPVEAVVLFPLVVGLTLMAAIGFGSMVAGFAAMYRDLTHVIPVLTQFLMWACPVAYSAAIIPDSYYLISRLNPMVGLIDCHRALLIGRSVDFVALGIAALVSATVFYVGIKVFVKLEHHFIDVV